MHEIEVEIGGVEICEGFVEGSDDVGGAVLCIPELAGDPVG